MKKIIVLLAIIGLTAGCDMVDPARSSAKSELKKVKLLEAQNAQLLRIANSLESIDSKLD